MFNFGDLIYKQVTDLNARRFPISYVFSRGLKTTNSTLSIFFPPFSPQITRLSITNDSITEKQMLDTKYYGNGEFLKLKFNAAPF